MHWAARNGRLEVCKWLVEQGCAADLPTHDGTTPLHWAVWQGQLAVCKYLVDGGLADVHARNSYGCNAVQWGAQSDVSENSDMCRWLQSVGLDLTLLNHNGHSAVHKANPNPSPNPNHPYHPNPNPNPYPNPSPSLSPSPSPSRTSEQVLDRSVAQDPRGERR